MLTIGAEIEYATKPGTNIHRVLSEDIERLNLELEYYKHMVEFNEILLSTELDPNSISKALKEISKIIKEKAVEIKKVLNRKGKKSWRVYISPIPFQKYNGLIWNGLHLHLGYTIKSPKRLLLIKAFATYWKYKNNWDLRSRTSHHIWGCHRESNYRFKRKDKFSPVINTSHGTLEFRIFSIEDIFFKRLREELSKFIYYLTVCNKYIKRIKFAEKFCEAMNWNLEDVRDVWNSEVNKTAEYIPQFERRKQLGRYLLYEKLENNQYTSRMFLVTNNSGTPKLLRKLVSNVHLNSV